MDKIIFIGSLIGMLGLGAVMVVPPIYRFVKARLPAASAKPATQPATASEVIAPVEAAVFPSGSDQRPPKAAVEYLQALKAACPGASMDILFSMALAGCSLFEATKSENARLLKLSQGEVK